MKLLEKLRRKSLVTQFAICISLIAVSTTACFFLPEWVDYQAIAILLLFVLSFIATIFERWPVFVAAIISALSWNFFFIPPRFNFHIASNADLLIFLMYFVIALLNVVLTRKIREIDVKDREQQNQERSIQLYNTILQTLSHELRTPIAGILGSIDTLNELKDKLSPEQISGLTQNMHICAMRLNDQVNKLLSMSRLEGNALKLHTDWVDVEDFLNSLITHNADLWPERKIILRCSNDLPLCRIDGALIYPAVFNLVQNAHLYSPGNGKITVKADVSENQLVISVADEGKGIPQEELDHLFEKFYRLPDSVAGGTGLGLSIVKGFAEVHGGMVEAENSTDGGAIFTLTVPCELSWIKSLKHD